MKLTLCPCCKRHVKSNGGPCPFCATKASQVSPGLLVALAVGAGAIVACSGSTDSSGTGGSPAASGTGGADQDAAADTADDQQQGFGGTSGAYGPPPDAADDNMSTAYGPPPDATAGAYGPPPDASDEQMSGAYGPPPDAGNAGTGGVYGPPPQ